MKARGTSEVFSLAQRIRAARMRRTWSRTELGALCFVSEGLVNNWESGRSRPVPVDMHRLAECFGVRAALLEFGGNEWDRELLSISPVNFRDTLAPAFRAMLDGACAGNAGTRRPRE